MPKPLDAEDDADSPQLPRLVKTGDAARDLAVSERHVRQLIAAGRITVVRIGAAVRIRRDELDRLAREGV
jgi:excisionase family DNA binding protein